MPRDEGKDDDEAKGGEGKADDDEAVALDPVVERFTEFCTSEALAEEVQAFVEDNCGPFEGAELGDEQRLEWTEVHRRYTDLLERRLEAFCKEENVDERLVFKKLRDAASASVERDFVPAVVQNAEYDHFFVNMKQAAEQRRSRREAEAAGGRMSGVWEYDGGRFDETGFRELLAAVKCPRAFRGIFLRSARKMKDIFIAETDDALTVKYSIAFFGARNMTWQLDDRPHPKLNAFRAKRVVTARRTRDGVVAETADPEGKATTSVHKFEVDGDEMHWTQTAKGVEVHHYLRRSA